jgi:carbonic anhydrase
MSTRSRFLSNTACGLALSSAALASQPVEAAAPAGSGLDASQGWERLRIGNERYAAGTLKPRDQVAIRRAELTGSQHPFAVVLACSDSRVAPELVFDQGLGDLFVVRIAGAVADGAGLGSLEYAVEHLHVPLLIVLGHESCGAVDASLGVVKGGEAHGHVRTLVDLIIPALKKSVVDDPGPRLINAVKATVRYEVGRLPQDSPVIAKAQSDGSLTIRGAYYNLGDGRVTTVS